MSRNRLDPEPGSEELCAADESEKDFYLQMDWTPCLWKPLKTYLMVPGLPRGADIEIQPLALSNSGYILSDSASDSSEQEPQNRLFLASYLQKKSALRSIVWALLREGFVFVPLIGTSSTAVCELVMTIDIIVLDCLQSEIL